MGIISKPYTFSPNTAIKPSEVNANIDTIYNAFNGNISGANLADNAITTVKITDGTITDDNIADGAVTTAKILDDAVTATKIDWASTGADGGIWWEELGRATASGATDTLSVDIEPRTFLRIIFYPIQTGSINTNLRFNSDSGNNYATRIASDGAADTTTTSQSLINIIGTASGRPIFFVYDCINLASYEKLLWCQRIDVGTTAGATGAPSRAELASKWSNTTAQITNVTISQTSTGDYSTGAELVILGHN